MDTPICETCRARVAAGIVAPLVLQLGDSLLAITSPYQARRPPVLRRLALSVTYFVITNTLDLIVGKRLVHAGWLEPVESLVA